MFVSLEGVTVPVEEESLSLQVSEIMQVIIVLFDDACV